MDFVVGTTAGVFRGESGTPATGIDGRGVRHLARSGDFVSQRSENSGISTLTPGTSNLADGWLSPGRTIRVRTETFDDWLAKNGIERVNLVKIDAEGAEAHIVRGMSGALHAGRIDALVCETEWDSDAHRLLCGFGFVPQALDTIGPLTNIAYARSQQ